MSEAARRFAALGSATVSEAGGACLPPGLQAVWPEARVAGPARTVRCASGDNLAVHAAVAGAVTGEVLCVTTEGDPERGYWGEVLTTGAQARGVAGLVIEAGVRDTAAIEARDFPVFAATRALASATKAGPGSVGEPVEMGGVTICDGDWVVADGDGIAVVAAAGLDAVLAAAKERAERETDVFARLEAGATTVELLGIDTSPVTVTRRID